MTCDEACGAHFRRANDHEIIDEGAECERSENAMQFLHHHQLDTNQLLRSLLLGRCIAGRCIAGQYVARLHIYRVVR